MKYTKSECLGCRKALGPQALLIVQRTSMEQFLLMGGRGPDGDRIQRHLDCYTCFNWGKPHRHRKNYCYEQVQIPMSVEEVLNATQRPTNTA